MAELPTGTNTTTQMNPHTPANTPALPGVNKAGGTLPNTIQVGPKPEIPASWVNHQRALGAVLDEYAANGLAAAQQLLLWVRAEISKLG